MQVRSFGNLMASLMVVLITATVCVLLVVQAQLFLRSVMTLADRIVEQTLRRIELRVQQLTDPAIAINHQTLRLVQGADLTPDNLARLEGFLAKSLELRTELTSIGLAIAATGEFIVAERRAGGAIRVRELRPDSQGRLHWTDWLWEGAARRLLGDRPWDGYDPRERPFYRLARDGESGVWTKTYPFWQEDNPLPILGISYASPWHDAKGRLVGVVNTDLELQAVCSFLASLEGELPGFAMILEETAEDQFRLVAHPRQEQSFDQTGTNLVASASEIADPVARSYIAALAKDRARLGAEEYGRRYQVDGQWYLSGFHRLSDPQKPPWIIAMTVPREAITGDIIRNVMWSLAASLVCLAVAVLAALWFARRMARPLRELCREAESVGRLQFETIHLHRSSIREVRQLQRSMAEMKASLRSFRKYVPADLVHELIASGCEARLGGQQQALTIFFSDIVDFTSLSESMPPQALVERVGEYLLLVSDIIHEHRGTVDKYIGDGVMAFWGAPHANPHHAADACRAAWHLQERLDQLGTEWQGAGKPPWRTRVGLHTGEVIVGNIGSEKRMNYTLIGDAVNLASRMEGLNKPFGTRILISEGTRESAGDAILARPVTRVVVKGRVRGVLVYELAGLAEEASPSQRDLAGQTIAAFQELEARNFARAREQYQAILKSHPHDALAGFMARRCEDLQRVAPGRDEDIVYRAKDK
ncbi:MAG: hypothetical protein KA118_04590 [Verrucomicrobia bacterium]|nr:hypothetical protein [Verrucomicrobiota bacterium]